MATHQLTALIQKEGEFHVAVCPELDIASQADTIDAARGNLIEALTLFFEVASDHEIQERRNSGPLVSMLEVPAP